MNKKTVKSIEDIARLANVSKSTVSRALNDSPLVKQETKDRICGIAKECHFRINAPARNLSLKKSHTIAFVTYAYHKDAYSAEFLFGQEMMSGITEGLYSLGYEMLVVHVDPRKSGWAEKYLDSGRVDGFILMTSARKQWHIKNLLEIDAPFIVWGVPLNNDKYCSVTGDDLTGGRLAAEYLVEKGRQRIAFLGGPKEELEVKQRYEGFATVIHAAGYEVAQERIAYGDYSPDSGYEAMKQLLNQSPDIDAVFVNSDLMAISAIKFIQKSGKQVPGDIAVIGYDDLSVAAYNNLPLTTIRQNIPMAGRLLAQNLIQFIKTGVITNVIVPVELIVRESA